jgi:hypothetical protein
MPNVRRRIQLMLNIGYPVSPHVPSDSNAMTQIGNVVLYLDKELTLKSEELGFNLSKTFENHLKHLMIQFPTGNSVNNYEPSFKPSFVAGEEGFEPSTPNLGGWCSIRTELLVHSLISETKPIRVLLSISVTNRLL